MAYKLITPSKTYNAKYCGVQFENGVGIFEDEKLAEQIAKSLGYTLEKIGAKNVEPKDADKAPAKAKPTPKKAPTKKAGE